MTLSSLIGRVHEAIDSGSLDVALRDVRAFVEKIITEPLCTGLVFGSRKLDQLCQEIGSLSWEPYRQATGGVVASQGNGPCVYIISRLQNSGGHCRIIEHFIRARPGSRHIILSTELGGRSDIDHFLGQLPNFECRFERSPPGNLLARLVWLQTLLVSLSASKVYLFNHHSDSVAVAAIQPEMGLDAWFYHHGDHHLSLGVHLQHLQHIDPHPMGYHNCRDRLGIQNFYIPLTAVDRGCRPQARKFMRQGTLTTCTAARSNKIEIHYFINYLEVIPELLRATGGKHIHIGRLTPWAILKLRWALFAKGIPSSRFVYIPWVPSVWQFVQEQDVDLYLASFPYGGGLTLIEIMGAGVPAILHKHIWSKFLSGIELSYPQAFFWRHLDELIECCTSMTPGVLAHHSGLAREHYEKYHRPEILSCSLEDPSRDPPCPRHPEAFVQEADEWAAMIESHVSLRALIRRFGYRFLRRVRTKFGW